MTDNTTDALTHYLYALGDATLAQHSTRFFKCGEGEYGYGDTFLGIRVPVVRQAVRHFRDTRIEAIVPLLDDAYHEVRLFALLSMVARYPKMPDTIYALYMKHIDRINNWDLVDTSAPQIVGTYLLTRDRAILYTLARSKVLWERRIAVLATFAFIRERDFADILKLSEMLLEDSEDLMHKAVGWMLREMGKRDERVLRTFLDAHASLMPRTMLRYAIEKLDEEVRKGYMQLR
ncbi:MAG: DNA alkylation repair protein [Sulfuricurvum sp. PC08-66]|nr:MAG: DNA alkylation repair protein [Sulfuricurvum sp. PC08-66]